MGFQLIFGGSSVYPSNQTYKTITLNANTQLAWPIESVSTETVVADLMDITPVNMSGWNLTLPDATGGSTGVTMILNNLSGVYSYNLLDNLGNTVLASSPGTVWLIYLTDNSTQGGTWRTFQYGAQAGSVNVAAIAGSGILAIGTSLNQSMPVSAKSSNYTAVDADRASVILWQGASGTLTLPAASGEGNNWFINVANKGTGALTVTPTSGLIDGASSKVFAAGTGSAIIFTDGSNYYTLGYGATAGASSFDYTTLDATGSDGVNGQIVLTGAQLNRISYLVTGILSGNRTIVVPNTVQQYWINNQTTSSGGPWTLTIKTNAGTGQTVSQPGQAILYCDGTNVQAAQSGITLPVAVASGGTGATTVPAARTNLGSTATGDALFTAASASAARTVLGSTTVGDALFVSASVNAALNVLAGGTMTGTLAVTGQFGAANVVVTSSALPGANLAGIYRPALNQLGFATNNIQAGYFDASQNLNLAHALGITSGGTGGTTLSSVAGSIGVTAPTPNTLVARDASGYINSVFYNFSGAAQDFPITGVMYEQANDGYIRKNSVANFRIRLDSGYASGSSTGNQTMLSGIIFQWGPTGDCVGSGAATTVTFGTAFPNANWVVFLQENNAHLAGSAQAATHVNLVSRTQFQVINNSNGTQAFYYLAIGN